MGGELRIEGSGGAQTYTREEWINVMRSVKPGLTEADYAAAWDRYHKAVLQHLQGIDHGLQPA